MKRFLILWLVLPLYKILRFLKFLVVGEAFPEKVTRIHWTLRSLLYIKPLTEAHATVPLRIKSLLIKLFRPADTDGLVYINLLVLPFYRVVVWFRRRKWKAHYDS